jgi:hypothetical protein
MTILVIKSMAVLWVHDDHDMTPTHGCITLTRPNVRGLHIITHNHVAQRKKTAKKSDFNYTFFYIEVQNLLLKGVSLMTCSTSTMMVITSA